MIGGAIAGATLTTGLNQMITPSAGDNAKDIADQIYPGTTPFERLSAGGGGAAGAGATESASSKAMTAQINAATQANLTKQKEIKNTKTIADNNNKTAKEVAQIQAGAKTDTSVVDDAIGGAASTAEYINEERKATDARRAMTKQQKRYYDALEKSYGKEKAKEIWSKENATGKFIPSSHKSGVTGTK